MSFIRIGDENFFDIEGSPLWIFQNFKGQYLIFCLYWAPFLKRGPIEAKIEILTLKVLKNPKGGPFYVKKNLISDSAQILSFIRIGDEKFFIIEGSPLWISQNFEGQYLKNTSIGAQYQKGTNRGF